MQSQLVDFHKWIIIKLMRLNVLADSIEWRIPWKNNKAHSAIAINICWQWNCIEIELSEKPWLVTLFARCNRANRIFTRFNFSTIRGNICIAWKQAMPINPSIKPNLILCALHYRFFEGQKKIQFVESIADATMKIGKQTDGKQKVHTESDFGFWKFGYSLGIHLQSFYSIECLIFN